MSLARFRARNHPQQTRVRDDGALALFDAGIPLVITDDIDDRGTDPILFAELDARYHFTLDVAASHGNAKCDRYLTRDDDPDGLSESWAGQRVWCNPPYSRIGPWVEKAWAETDAEIVVMLLPANRTEQGWWQDLVEPRRDRTDSRLRTEFLRGRRRFIMPGNERIESNERPPFGIVLLIWGW